MRVGNGATSDLAMLCLELWGDYVNRATYPKQLWSGVR